MRENSVERIHIIRKGSASANWKIQFWNMNGMREYPYSRHRYDQIVDALPCCGQWQAQGFGDNSVFIRLHHWMPGWYAGERANPCTCPDCKDCTCS
jgi:hypothetical protein